MVAGVGRALDAIEDFRFDDEVLADARGRRRRADARLALDLPLLRRRLGVRRGRDLLPLLAPPDRRGHLRRGGAARDAAAVDLQPRLGDRVGRLPDDPGRRRPAVHRDGVTAYPRGGRGRVPPRGVRRRVRDHLQPRRPCSGTACRRPARARTASRSCTTPRPTRSGRRWRRSAPGRPSWSTPTTSARRSRLGIEIAGTELGAVRIDSGDQGVLAHEVRAQLDALGATEDPDHRDQRPRRVRDRRAGGGARRRVRRRHPAGHRVRAPDLRLRLQARRARGRRRRDGVGGEEEHRQDLDRRPQVRDAPAVGRRRRRGRGDRDRQAAGERRRRPRARSCRWCATARWSAASRSTRRATAAPGARAELPHAAEQMSRGEPVIPTEFV